MNSGTNQEFVLALSSSHSLPDLDDQETSHLSLSYMMCV